jgi:putative transposase
MVKTAYGYPAPLRTKGPGSSIYTTTATNWIPIFSVDEAALIALDELNKTLTIYPMTMMAYVLMPSHFHGILFSPQIEALSKFVQCFKSIISRGIKKLRVGSYNKVFYNKGRYRLWKPRFDDFVIRNKKQFMTKLNYIHENPVRAGIVENPIDYKYSSAREWLTGEKGLVNIDPTIAWR